MGEKLRGYGWSSKFPEFRDTPSSMVREQLIDFLPNAGRQQIYSWDESIPKLQLSVEEILRQSPFSERYQTILEYELPMESRRTDAIFLVSGSVVVVELKGKERPSQADIDQAAAYARDLRCYHQECAGVEVEAVLVPTHASGYLGIQSEVHILGPDYLEAFLREIDSPGIREPLPVARFLSPSAYRPLPTLVQAARELMKSGTIRTIHRARAATEPALREITRIIKEAAAARARRLILLSGVPGAGKTLVGLQAVHAHFLDDLAVPRPNGKPTAPAVFLSGNGPLVEVLQYELRSAGGGGRTFVRGVLDYIKRYSMKSDLIPPEHVLVFDEAQRAFDEEQVRAKHSHRPGFEGGKSEPAHFIEFAGRVPEWCVVVGLIGQGQEIHVGEEGGVAQWREAVVNSGIPGQWGVHVPPHLVSPFAESSFPVHASKALDLDTEIRFHLAKDIHQFVKMLLDEEKNDSCPQLGAELDSQGYHWRITRSLEVAKEYLKERYAENENARYGLVASSRDKDLVHFQVKNDFQTTRNIRFGPWYGDPAHAEGGRSCRHLRDCITEFGAQGLELDAVLLAWGTDFLRKNGEWSIAKARGFKEKGRVKNPFQLRKNAYRVLLTRGRDATVVFVPSLPELDETYGFLVNCGFRLLDAQ